MSRVAEFYSCSCKEIRQQRLACLLGSKTRRLLGGACRLICSISGGTVTWYAWAQAEHCDLLGIVAEWDPTPFPLYLFCQPPQLSTIYCPKTIF